MNKGKPKGFMRFDWPFHFCDDAACANFVCVVGDLCCSRDT